VIAGKSMLSFRRHEDGDQGEPAGKCFAFVQTFDQKPKRRLFELLKNQGMQENQQIGGFCITLRKGSIQHEQHLWFECNRLIVNCIHLLQRHAPLSTCLRTRRAVGYKLRIYQTGFRCRVNLDGRNEFRKHVAETVRELAEIRIENRHRFGGVILD
jgi:hypothetical protein